MIAQTADVMIKAATFDSRLDIERSLELSWALGASELTFRDC